MTYTISISGRGCELVMATLTSEQVDYWSQFDDSGLEEHIFKDPTETDEESDSPNPVTDPTDPVFLGQWNDMESQVVHINAVLYDMCYIVVADDEGNQVWVSDIVPEDQYKVEYIRPDEDYDSGVIVAWSTEAGEFMDCDINTNVFDPAKLAFKITMLEDDGWITAIKYDGELLTNCVSGETSTKGYNYQIY